MSFIPMTSEDVMEGNDVFFCMKPSVSLEIPCFVTADGVQNGQVMVLFQGMEKIPQPVPLNLLYVKET
jgi:hypothetical protein